MTQRTQNTNWLVYAGQPFKGHVQSYLLDDGTVAYTKGLTPEQYGQERGFPVKVITDAELDDMMAAHLASLITGPTEETEKQFDYALGVMPPSKWRTARGVESFHICERITQNLVSWHARLNGRFYTFTDRDTLTAGQVADKVAAHV